MKIILIFILFLILPNISFSATLKDAEDRLRTIEDFKNGISASKDDGLFSDEEMEALNLLYQVLEGDEYTVSSLDGGLDFYIGDYSLLETKWPTEIRGTFFNSKYSYERSVDILYSTVMEKKYVAEQDMTEYQRRDYEYYVNDYENRIRSGEKVIYAELTFKLTHWQGSSEYRFEPISLIIYKNSKRPRAILSIDETQNKDFFSFSDSNEFRTEGQQAENSSRIKKLLKAEEKQEAEEKSERKKKTEQKGRRAVYISAELEQDNFSFSNMNLYNLNLKNMSGTLTWGMGKFIFAGLVLGIDIDSSINENSIYSFGGIMGLNLNLGEFFRPYTQTGISARTDDKVIFKIGAGLDFTIGHFLLNLEYNYNWNNALDATNAENSKYSTYSIGMGLAW